MNFFRDLSIRRKLTAIAVIAAGTALLGAGAAFVTYDLVTYRTRLVRALRTQAEIIGLNSASAILFQDATAAGATLGGLRAEPRVMAAAIYRPDRSVFATYQRPGEKRIPVFPRRSGAPLAGHEFRAGRLVLAHPVAFDGAMIGTVVIESDLGELTNRLTQYLGIVAAVLACSVLVALAAAARLQRIISEPVRVLVEAARRVSRDRDYSIRAAAKSRDELGQLVTTFNEMLGQIEARDFALLRARDDLEREVSERTDDLRCEIGDRKLLEEQLRRKNEELMAQSERVQEASRLKSQFLANMSHELRTPLNAIIGFSELMHDAKLGAVSPMHKECLGDILTSSRHLLQLINDVLDLSKVEAGRMEFRPESVELEKLVGEVRDILRSLSAEKRIQIAVEIDRGIGPVMVDPARLKQVLYNYLSNALKFTPEGGRITVRFTTRGEEHFGLEVEDSGIGIHEEDLPRLFIEFQQLDDSTAKRHPGTGLGLALTRRIIEAQGGRVGVRSTPGQGSTFEAVLPRIHAGSRSPAGRASTAAVPSRPVPEAPPSVPAGSDVPTVLVIEDDARDREWLLTTLRDAGVHAEVAGTGAEALRRCREQSFAAITLDLLLPDLSGWEVLRGIRAGRKNRHTPTIVVSVVADLGLAGAFRVHDCLTKPLTAEDLFASLERAGITPRDRRPVLVVDDDPAALKLMQMTLAELGYRSVAEISAADGLSRAAEELPAAIILDLVMPEMDGFTFLDRLRGIENGDGVPVLIWTMKELTAEDHVRLADSARAILHKGNVADLVAELRPLLIAKATESETLTSASVEA